MKGRARHPQSQGSVERSHKAFQDSLCKWIAQNGDNWLLGMHIVQCELNKCPSRVRGNITPYSIYYGCPNTTSYSAILGNAYTEARTEYGLLLAKKLLEAMKKHNSQHQMTEEEIRSIIRKGDRIFDKCSRDNTMDPNEALKDKLISTLVAYDIHIPPDDAEVMETNFYDDDDVPNTDVVPVSHQHTESAVGTDNVEVFDDAEPETELPQLEEKEIVVEDETLSRQKKKSSSEVSPVVEVEDDGTVQSRELLYHLLFYEVNIPFTEEGLMFRLTKYDGEMFCAAIDGYRRHKNNDVALVEQNQTFKSKGDRIVRIEDESMRKKPFQWVFDCLSHYAKTQSTVNVTMLHASYAANTPDIPLTSQSIEEANKEEQRKQSATMANQAVAETETEEQKKSMEDLPLGLQIIQESQEIVDKVGAMERNEENEKEKETKALFSAVIESYLDPSFESMQKATENVVGDNTIAEAVDDDLESMLMLSKMPFVNNNTGKTTEDESNEGKKDEQKGTEEATEEKGMELVTNEKRMEKATITVAAENITSSSTTNEATIPTTIEVRKENEGEG